MAKALSWAPSIPLSPSQRACHLNLTKKNNGRGRMRLKTISASSSHKVEIEHRGQKHVLEVAEDETILERALEEGIDLPYDCKLGVCMTCPAKLISGTLDQSEGMLSDDVIDRGYALMCASYPRSPCTILTIPEEELLSLQLVTAND